MIDFLKNIILFILLLSVLTIVHEFGHFIAAKAFGVYVPEFSIGMGPLLFSKQGKETKFSLRLFLIGGYVSLADDLLEQQGEEKLNIPSQRTIAGISRFKRIIIMSAGIFMNILLAVVIYGGIILNNGYYPESNCPQIVEITPDSPAQKSELLVGDKIISVAFSDGLSLHPDSYFELSSFLSTYSGEGDWIFEVKRDEQNLTIKLTPQYSPENGKYMMGVAFANSVNEYSKVNIFNCLFYGAKYCIFVIKLLISSLATIFTGAGMDNLSGPIGVYNVVKESAQGGFSHYIELLAMISLNIGVFNALPLAILDGGKVFITLIEMILRRPINKKLEMALTFVALALILSIFIFATYNDISKLIGG